MKMKVYSLYRCDTKQYLRGDSEYNYEWVNDENLARIFLTKESIRKDVLNNKFYNNISFNVLRYIEFLLKYHDEYDFE